MVVHLCSTGNHSTYLRVVVRIKWINMWSAYSSDWHMERAHNCHSWSWWRWLDWLLGNGAQGWRSRWDAGAIYRTTSAACCSTAAATAAWNPPSFIHSTWKVWVYRCAVQYGSHMAIESEIWLVWIEMRYKCEIPTLNFEDLVEVKCFINSFLSITCWYYTFSTCWVEIHIIKSSCACFFLVLKCGY